MLQKSTKRMQNPQTVEREQAAILGAFRKQKLNSVVNVFWGFLPHFFFIKAIPQNFSLRLWSAIWNSELLAIISYLGLGWQNAIIISVSKNIGPGEYSSGLRKCRFPLGAIWHRPSLLRQLAKNNLTVFPCLVKPPWSKMLDQLT